MKKYYLLLLSVFLLSTCWISCSKDDAPKMISPVETDFVSGGLSKLIEVVNEPCELKMVVRDDAIASQIFQLKVKLKLKKESPALQSIDAQDISFTELLSVAIVTLEDTNGTKVQELNVRSEELLKLKKLLQAKEGAEAEIVFEATFHNSEDAPKWYEQTVQFRPYLTGDVAGSANASEANLALQCAVINDADGWTNVRVQPNMNAAIVTKIYDGEQFYFERVPGSNWVKVYRTADATENIGYMHGSRVMPVSGAADMNNESRGGASGKVEIILPSELNGYVAVVPDNYEVTVDRYGFPEISVTFKLLKKVNTAPLLSSYGQMWIVGVGQDAQGRAVKELLPNYEQWRTNDSDGKEFKEFLESSPGNTITMTFTGGNEGDVEAGVAKVAKLKLKIDND